MSASAEKAHHCLEASSQASSSMVCQMKPARYQASLAWGSEPADVSGAGVRCCLTRGTGCQKKWALMLLEAAGVAGTLILLILGAVRLLLRNVLSA